ELVIDAAHFIRQRNRFIEPALEVAQGAQPAEESGAQGWIACPRVTEPLRRRERLLGLAQPSGNAQSVGVLAPAERPQVSQLRSAAGDRHRAGFSSPPCQVGEMKHASRALVADAIAQLDELLDQTRIGETAVGADLVRLLLLRKRSELGQEIVQSTLGRSSFGKEGAERLLGGDEGPAVVVGSFGLPEALFFAVDREPEEALQAPLAPAHGLQLMPAGRARGQEVAQDPGIPRGHTRSRGAPQEALA